MGFDIEQTFISLYLGEIPDNLNNREKYLLKVLLAASKKPITTKWLQKDPPTVTQWIDFVEEIHHMERMTFEHKRREVRNTGKMCFVHEKVQNIQRCQCN